MDLVRQLTGVQLPEEVVQRAAEAEVLAGEQAPHGLILLLTGVIAGEGGQQRLEGGGDVLKPDTLIIRDC